MIEQMVMQATGFMQFFFFFANTGSFHSQE